jgi:aspartyl protease family protein
MCLALLIPDASALGDTGGLRARLETLAAERQFVIEGLDRVGEEAAKIAEGKPVEQLRRLLEEYNYVAIDGDSGEIARIVITSRRQPAAKLTASPYVKTMRLGAHHVVDATITGAPDHSTTVPLIVDTGASTVVLPESLMAPLGFHPADLQDGITRTASGSVAMKLGVLKSIEVGNAFATDVGVTFIADGRLGGMALLGMSFLERFRMTIDDARNELILLAK